MCHGSTGCTCFLEKQACSIYLFKPPKTQTSVKLNVFKAFLPLAQETTIKCEGGTGIPCNLSLDLETLIQSL